MDRVPAKAEAAAETATSRAARDPAPEPRVPGSGLVAGALRSPGAAAGPALLRLQQGAGNRAVAALLQRCGCDDSCGCGTAAYERHRREEDERLSRSVAGVKERLAASLPSREAVARDVGGRVAALQRQDVAEAEGEQTEAVPLQQPPAGGGTGPTPTFDHSGGQTVTINADTAMDFANNITATIGSPHVSPVLEPDIAFDTTPTGKKITSIGLKVSTAITKVRWGLGRPNDKHKAAIKEMVEAIKAHEEKHRAIIEAEATTALKDAQKFVGTGQLTAANAALTTKLECAMNKKHEALDGTEGKLTASEDANGNVSVSKSGSGATYPCP